MYYDKPKTIIKRYNGFVPKKELDDIGDRFPECLEKYGVSGHIKKHRQTRFDTIQLNAGDGQSIARFLVEREGRDEIHTIFDNGIIITQLADSIDKKVITFMFGRPEQIKEYWIGMDETFPNEISYLLDVADENQYLAWHN